MSRIPATQCRSVGPDPVQGNIEPSSDLTVLSKSKYLWGLQCPKLLWHVYNAKHLIPGPDALQQAVFDHGHEVGALARQLFPDGVEIAGASDDFDAILAESKKAVRERRSLYEAAFTINGGYAIRFRVRRRLLPKGFVVIEAILGIMGAGLLFAWYGVLAYSIIG